MKQSLLAFLTNPLNRWRHRHGFGVQSPWAYALVRDALFEQLRYYAFDELGGTRDDEQLFRLAIWLRPAKMMTVDVSERGKQYVLAARPGVKFLPFSTDGIDPQVCLVMEHISGRNHALWLQVLSLPQTTSTFDLGHRGIAFFDPARQRQNYLL